MKILTLEHEVNNDRLSVVGIEFAVSFGFEDLALGPIGLREVDD